MLRCEAEQLPLADRSVDIVTSFNAVHHFDLERFTREVARVLRPGGHLFVYTRTPEQNAESIWGRAFPGFLSHESRLQDETTLERVLGRLGAVEITRSSSPVGPPLLAWPSECGAAPTPPFAGTGLTSSRSAACFLEHLDGGDVEWNDHNLLVHVQRPG